MSSTSGLLGVFIGQGSSGGPPRCFPVLGEVECSFLHDSQFWISRLSSQQAAERSCPVAHRALSGKVIKWLYCSKSQGGGGTEWSGFFLCGNRAVW